MEFLIELVSRLFADTPKFFKVVRTIGIVLAVVTGLPAYLQSTGVVLPEGVEMIASKVVSYASIAATFIAQLTATTTAKQKLEIKE